MVQLQGGYSKAGLGQSMGPHQARRGSFFSGDEESLTGLSLDELIEGHHVLLDVSLLIQGIYES